MTKFLHNKLIATDLARLKAIREALKNYQRVVWLDADFLIFTPDQFILPNDTELPEGYALGREVWVQPETERQGKLRAHVKVHNAFLLFDRQNSFLDFYLEHARRLLEQCNGAVPPQFIGPKLLTALHNIVRCPVFEPAGMFSPAVIEDLLSDGEQLCALNLMKKRSQVPIAGANLCHSLAYSSGRTEDEMLRLTSLLISNGCAI